MELNVFQSISPSTDPKIIHRRRYLTRIYVILLFTALFILILHTAVRQETVSVIIRSPSLSQYQQLFSEYPLTLQCPCRHTAMKYQTFITQFEPEYHQICSSIFVSTEWIASMLDPGDAYLLLGYESDFMCDFDCILKHYRSFVYSLRKC